jgi:hypothetical protein
LLAFASVIPDVYINKHNYFYHTFVSSLFKCPITTHHSLQSSPLVRIIKAPSPTLPTNLPGLPVISPHPRPILQILPTRCPFCVTPLTPPPPHSSVIASSSNLAILLFLHHFFSFRTAPAHPGSTFISSIVCLILLLSQCLSSRCFQPFFQYIMMFT